MYQKYIVVGRLTKDGENRFLPSGSQVYKNSIASDRKYKKQDGNIATEVMYMDFSAFGGLANTMNTYLHKGSLCLLEGYIQFEQWTANDGSTRSRHSLRVDTMKMLDSKGAESNNTYNPEHQPESYSTTAESNHHYQSPRAMDRKIPEIDIDVDEIPFSEVTAPIHNADKFYVKCISCKTTFDTDKYDLDLEHDGDICGFCPKCNCSKIFFEVDINGNYK